MKLGLDDLLRGVQTVAIVCNQWGDSGKGKFADWLAQWADVNARGTGGHNAGHTVDINGRERIYHLIPVGIAYDSFGKITVLGNGMVIDVPYLCGEIDGLAAEGIPCNNLRVSKDAHLILPCHTLRDQAKNKSQKDGGIGSTGRGIGPCYADKIGREGVLIENLFDRDLLERKIQKLLAKYEALRRGEFSLSVANSDELGLRQVKTLLDKIGIVLPDEEYERISALPAEELLDYYKSLVFSRIDIPFETESIIGTLMPFAERIRPFVRDTVSEMREFMKQGKRISLEGAQGLLLGSEHGTYPYNTGSDCSVNGTASGVGLSAKMIDLPLGIVKFPLMTRVGGGAFPTEISGRESEKYCAADMGNKKIDELIQYEIPHQVIDGEVIYDKADPKILRMLNSNDEFIKGVGIRLAAGEYGATTTRPRRIGWTDAVSARYAIGINGPLMILTKPDSVSGIDNFKLCYGYRNGNVTTEIFSRDDKFLRGVQPVYKTYDGYGDIRGTKDYDELPASLQQAIGEFENFTGGKVVIVSTGKKSEDTIVR